MSDSVKRNAQWVRLGMHEVVTDKAGQVIAKILIGKLINQPNQHDQPIKAWVYGKHIGEYITPQKAKESAETWLRLGPPVK